MLSSKKMLVSLVLIVVIAISIGNVISLATTPIVVNTAGSSDTGNTTGAGTITVSSNNTATKNTTTNTSNTAENVVNKVTNSSSYNTTNTTKKSLPYAGTNSNVIFVVIALVVSAIYAYKKVSDYNV